MAVVRRINSIDRLMELAGKRKAVWFGNWAKPIPAAVVIGMPVRVVFGFIQRGLWEYKKP